MLYLYIAVIILIGFQLIEKLISKKLDEINNKIYRIEDSLGLLEDVKNKVDKDTEEIFQQRKNWKLDNIEKQLKYIQDKISNK